jgi:hypothetical protein
LVSLYTVTQEVHLLPPSTGADDAFKSLVIENFVSLSKENKLISDKIDDLIDVAKPVEIVKNVLLEWKFN